VGREGWTGEPIRHLDGEAVALQVGDTGGAEVQMLFDVVPVLRQDFAGGDVEEKFGQLATGDHTACSSK
jgi:hypothetical protein